MINPISVVPKTLHPVCEVCDTAISYPDYLKSKDLDYSVCQSFECRRVMSQKSNMSELFFKAHLKFHKKLLRQRQESDAARKKYIDDINEKEARQNAQIVKLIYKRHREKMRDSTRVLVIPSGNSESVDISDERKNNYIEHLTEIINEASKYNSADDVMYDEHHDAYYKKQIIDKRLKNMPALRMVSDNLCCICKGGCCASGKDHAYLSVFSVRRFMDENKHLTSDEVLRLYISKITTESINQSCINQTLTGCVLPRNMRSDICNGYYCESLKTYQKNTSADDNALSVIAIQRSSTYWSRYSPGVNNEITNVSLVEEMKVTTLLNQKTRVRLD